MGKKNSKNNSKNNSKDPAAHAKVIKAGVYDGSESSSDFVVSGHSTGSSNTEMEALSHQVSRDVGAVPAYPTDNYYRSEESTTDLLDRPPELNRGDKDFSDLGGPLLYGPKPSLLRDSPLNSNAQSWFSKRTGVLSALGLAAAAAIGFVTVNTMLESSKKARMQHKNS